MQALRDTQEQTSELLDLSRKMTAATDRKAVLNAAEQHFSGWKELYLCLVDRDGQGGLVVETGGPLTFSEAERAAAEWAWQHDQPAGSGTGTLPSGRWWWWWPITAEEGPLALLGVSAREGQSFTAQHRRLLAALTQPLAQALARAQLAQELEAARLHGETEQLRSALLASVSHDLRTPLTRLRAQLYRIQQQSAHDSPHSTQIAQVISEADTLMARFRGLLRISELEDRQRRSAFIELELQPLLQELHDFYLPLAEEDQITLLLDLHDTLPTLVGDRALLFEALTNLLGNAIKFTPSGGIVKISAYPSSDGITPCIEVQDSGPGIPVAERAAVFQRFYRSETGTEQSGFGLGLSVVAAIVNLHGFTLQIGISEYGGASLLLECRTVNTLA
ncbi:Sensor histidine kinase [Pseudomonas savastanoi pv. nerii]|nr:Sensor histidine kinase [Pseudomonas savastanoi pv. nerii]